MLAAFPRHDGWVTLRLADAPDDGQPLLLLLELLGSCPGDLDAQPRRLTSCASAREAHEQAAQHVAAGWASYADERPAGPTAARAGRHSRAAAARHARPRAASHRPTRPSRGGARRRRQPGAVLPVPEPHRPPLTRRGAHQRRETPMVPTHPIRHADETPLGGGPGDARSATRGSLAALA